MLDSARTQWMNAIWTHLSDGPPEEIVFSFGYSSFYRAVTQTGQKLGIEVVPYQGRHSGISIDRATGARPLAEAGKRGRWKSEKSLRRYEKAGTLSAVWQKLPDETRRIAIAAERTIKQDMLEKLPRRSFSTSAGRPAASRTF